MHASSSPEVLSIRGARVHNLKNISVDIQKQRLTVITGLSGSGKSSLAFDTIFAEGQRRYVESLSSYARQFLELQEKPDVDEIHGLSPTIAIDQKSTSHNPRSTVGTMTEIYDYLRVLFARVGTLFCPDCRGEITECTVEDIVRCVEEKITDPSILLSPLVDEQKGSHKTLLIGAQQSGFTRVRFDGLLLSIEEALLLPTDKLRPHTIELVCAEMTPEALPKREILSDLVKRALEQGGGSVVIISLNTGDEWRYSQALSCSLCHRLFPRPEPRLFSFNTPHGACSECGGLGCKHVFDGEAVVTNPKLTIAQGAIQPWMRLFGQSPAMLDWLQTIGKKHGFSVHEPFGALPPSKQQIVLRGTGAQLYEYNGTKVPFKGILTQLEDRYRDTDSEHTRKELEEYMRILVCPSCSGKRLRPEALSTCIGGENIADVVAYPLDELNVLFLRWRALPLSPIKKQILERSLQEIERRLHHLLSIGLSYLTLNRSAISLSGGESQRVRLSTQLGTGLSGVIYILDEPSIGLHPRDTEKLITALKTLRDLGNTVIVVEHDELMIRAADDVIDIGPGAGVYGGEIVGHAPPEQLALDEHSPTGAYLSHKKAISYTRPAPLVPAQRFLTIRGASAFNLKDVEVAIPLSQFVCVTGVSGSGKSTLILDILAPALSRHFYRSKAVPAPHRSIEGIEAIDKVVTVDQSPIGRTPRSNPATYTGLFTTIREIFAQTPEARMRHFDAGVFSFNVKGGRCEACLGEGQTRIEMQFLPDMYTDCSECGGMRYHADVLEVHYKGKSIADVLNMTIEEARRFFVDHATLSEKIGVLCDVGLGYIRLGQSATTLSGGEAQRVKLSTELSRRSTGKTLFILDEPTTGLHFEDIQRLLQLLRQLVEKGNSVVVIEHHLDVIAQADHIIDMGPEGGVKGGRVVASGTPKEVANHPDSVTGYFLRPFMQR